jgi:hypothetical protein
MMHSNAAVKNRLGGMAGGTVEVSADGIDPFVASRTIAAGGRGGGVVQFIDGRLTGRFMARSTIVDRGCGIAVAGGAVVKSVVCAVVVHRHTAVARFALVTGRAVKGAVGDACVAGCAIVG